MKAKSRYGYRRVTQSLRNKNIIVNHKKVLRIMKELGILCTKFSNRVRKFNSYKGEFGKISQNIIERNFFAEKPNKIWLTDITEFRIKGSEDKVYLSPILDTFNSEIVSFSISKHPNTKLTNESLKRALECRKDIDNLIIHTDQGFHYQHSSWVKKLEENRIIQSMSRKGNCLDNSPMENFFSMLKQEMFYGEEFESTDTLIRKIEEYIRWYNEDRIKIKLNGLSPVQYRLQSA